MLKTLLFTAIVSLAVFALPHDLNAHSENAPAFAKCYGRTPCRACKNCNYCKHCNAGGTCGVCKPPKPKKPAE